MEKDISNYEKKFTELYRIISRLRGPEGCPWDRKQTPETIRRYLEEEATELAEAMSGGKTDQIREETGDLFFILLLIARIYEERGMFTLAEALEGISRKMIRRHPHVFAGQQAGSESELKAQWEAIKAAEKRSGRETKNDRKE